MKILLTATITSIVLLTSISATADVYVQGYTKSNGTYVAPHYRTNPDGVCWNNYSGC